MISEIEKFVHENEDAIFADIARLVAVPSVGNGKEALAEALKIAEEMGLETHNCEDIIGYACVGGNGDDYFATITHVDVVDVGDGWNSDPWMMTERDGYIIGRGVMDDKGPTILCLYALKYLQEKGIALKAPVRALIGTDEEVGMSDVEYFLANYPQPRFCFSPDADFPLINGEKGIYHAKIVALKKADKVESISGGFAANAIPSYAEACVSGKKLSTEGVQGHASLPQGTKNAIGELLRAILGERLVSGEEAVLLEKFLAIDTAWDGSDLGISARNDRFGPLTCAGGIISMEDGRIFRTIDCRYPDCTSGPEITAKLREFYSGVAEVVEMGDSVPFYMEADAPEIKACLDAYNEVTGENAHPFVIGGGTYSRHMANAVAFGPERDRVRPDFAGPIHGTNESACKQELLEALQIYILTLLNLEK